MADIKQLKEIVTILIDHSSEGDDLSCSAEHDELFLGGPNVETLDAAVVTRLGELNCTWDDDFDCWHKFT